MKKWLIFGSGVLTGFVLTIILAFALSSHHSNNGITWFENAGDIVEEKSFEVFQVIDKNAALVRGESEFNLYLGPVYLLTNGYGKYYYDEEIVKVPKGNVVRQVGIYKYQTTSDSYKTVPIIQIMDK